MRTIPYLVTLACICLGLAAFTNKARATSERLLYQFYNLSNPTHGVYPVAVVADASGALYGLTVDDNRNSYSASGVIFKLSPPPQGSGSWTQTVLHRLAADGSEGLGPVSLTIDANGTLYGVTVSNGSFGNGVVFRLTPPVPGQSDGTFSVIYAFPEQLDVFGPLVVANGNLYGTTLTGGSGTGCSEFEPEFPGCGTIFQLSPPTGRATTTWTRRVYALPGGDRGSYPLTLVSDRSGHLAGSTRGDFDHINSSPGTVFRIDPPTASADWSMTVLARFTDQYAAVYPEVYFSGATGALYGLTGRYACGNGQGACHTDCPSNTSFCTNFFVLDKPSSDTAPWRYRQLYSFTDRDVSLTGLFLGKAGIVYGYDRGGCGTVVELDAPASGQTGWSEHTVYVMKGRPDDGCHITGLLRGLNWDLFGVTETGGKFAPGRGGLGTVFEITP